MKVKRGHPPGRLTLCGWRCGPTHGEPEEGALHGMREVAGSLGPLGPTRGELESQARPPAGAASALRLALRHTTHDEPDTRALHHMPKPVGRLRPPGPPREALEG
jgi:hypothetical protein